MKYDYDLFVIGAGSGGVRAARIAAGLGARVAVAEDRGLGGTCVNLGCVPKKMLVYGASYADDFEHARHYGWHSSEPIFRWSELRGNKDREISRLNGVYGQMLANAGVEILPEHAGLVDAHTVEVGGKRYTAEHLLIATGCEPVRPVVPGIEHAITSDEAFHLPALPRRVVVVGGGYIAVEFASIFLGMGAEVTQVYRGQLFLRHFDSGLRTHLAETLSSRGLVLKFGTHVDRIEKRGDGSLRTHLHDGTSVDADCVLYAVGRKPRLDGLNIEATRVALDERGFIAVDADYRTAEPSVFAIGDVIGRVQLTPVALAEGMDLARLLFRPQDRRPIDYGLVPTAVFTLPNIGTVGMTEDDARRQNRAVRIYESRFKPLKLTLTSSQERTLLKLIVDAKSDRVIGCHMVGPDAGEIIQGLAVAMKAGATKDDFDQTLGIHPTTAEEFVTMRTVRADR